MPNNFKAFTTNEQRMHTTVPENRLKYIAWLQEKKDLAAETDFYGGKRLLGTTEQGNPIYVTLSINKSTKDMHLALTHTMDTIRKSNLCPRRITVGANEAAPNLDHSMRPTTKSDNGEVTQRTLNYIEELIHLNESKIHYDNNKCTTGMFMKASNAIYEGSAEQGKFRWVDVMQTWDLPKGNYFTV